MWNISMRMVTSYENVESKEKCADLKGQGPNQVGEGRGSYCNVEE